MRQRKLTEKEAEKATTVPRRCAIYTRVSTDEQAALEYNSLQAQEDISKNYIAIRGADPALARKWVHAETYADAGFSGGTLDRPALKRLIADVEAGKIDVIVSYKIDRISRSISQFYEIWNLLEVHEVDFASATQEFNTATSQGKLMLNLLLSFAQYERELIGERTRDKIAAARKKGRWCGGKPILGYDIDRERKALVVNEPEAQIVRDIFATYLREMSLLRAVRAVTAKGYRTKAWTTAAGVQHEARTFDKVTLSFFLRNPAYLGKVKHHDKLYDGLHAAIVDTATFERVQQLLAGNCRHNASQAENVHGLVLKGLVRCAACGRAMSPNSAHGRHGRRYVYYTCQTATREGAGKCPVRSVSAPALEGMLVERLGQIVSDETIVAKMVEKASAEATQRLPMVRGERARLDAELRRQREEAQHLVDAIASGAVDARLVGDRLKEVQAAIEAGERRAAELEREAARLERSMVGPGQVRAALARFSDLWRTLEEGERGRLARLVVADVTYDGRDKANGQVTWKFRPFAVEPLPPAEAEGFDVGCVRRGGRDLNPRPPA
jgi:site-specific DNA recombinase